MLRRFDRCGVGEKKDSGGRGDRLFGRGGLKVKRESYADQSREDGGEEDEQGRRAAPPAAVAKTRIWSNLKLRAETR